MVGNFSGKWSDVRGFHRRTLLPLERPPIRLLLVHVVWSRCILPRTFWRWFDVDRLDSVVDYYRFDEMNTEHGKPTGWDRVRNAEIGNEGFDLEYIEEAFTSQHWLVRIYKVKDPENRGRD